MSKNLNDQPQLTASEVFFTPDSKQLQLEKEKAKKLRESAWWKRKRSSGLCHYCRRNFKPNQLTMDHLIPLARGGQSIKENLVPCCKQCNARKKYLLPAEFADLIQKERQQREAGQNDSKIESPTFKADDSILG
ncbi:MAG: HNH endonuclease [Leptonema sp. (in: Bacteria)]|nr:HNH endonuclease [Leptonema sp. (in: bacteria)]